MSVGNGATLTTMVTGHCVRIFVDLTKKWHIVSSVCPPLSTESSTALKATINNVTSTGPTSTTLITTIVVVAGNVVSVAVRQIIVVVGIVDVAVWHVVVVGIVDVAVGRIIVVVIIGVGVAVCSTITVVVI